MILILTELEAAAEAVLFAAGEAVPLSSFAAAIGTDEDNAKSIAYRLIDKYTNENRGIKIIEVNNSFQMCTNSDFYGYVAALFQNPQKKQLTQPLIETLAIIAYKQPVTKGQIEEIRGVDAGHAVNKLVEYGLVCEKGRLDAPGRPILFGTTDEFLKYYGFNSISKLPDLPEAEAEESEIIEEQEDMK